MIIDTHAHLHFPDYDTGRDEVIKRTLAAGVQCINVGVDLKTSQDTVALAEQQEGFWAAVGLHPTDVDEPLDIQKYRNLVASKKVVAIGEIGLDFFRKPYDEQKQKDIFLQQIDLALELDLPVIIHCRAAHDEMIEILREQDVRGVIHCFTGTWKQAKKYLGIGFYLGIGGIIFKFNIEETIKNMPLEKMVVETDCPYLTPPMALEKRNEPVFIKHTIQKIAELRGVGFEEVVTATTQNAKKLFNI